MTVLQHNLCTQRPQAAVQTPERALTSCRWVAGSQPREARLQVKEIAGTPPPPPPSCIESGIFLQSVIIYGLADCTPTKDCCSGLP